MRRTVLCSALLGTLALLIGVPPPAGAAQLDRPGAAAGAPSSSTGPALPSRYVVSRRPGVLPEGIGVGPGGVFYVTSSATGAVFRGHLDRPRLEVFVPAGAAGRRSALGVHADPAGRVFVAGSTALDVYSPGGRLLAHRPAPAGPVVPASLNDLVITGDAVYVTDFANPVVLRAAIHAGRIGPLRPWLNVAAVNPGLPAQFWFLNGIVATADGHALLVASQGLEQLLRVTVATRAVRPVDVGLPFAADGLVLRGRIVYAVLNFDPPAGEGVYVARLNSRLTGGRILGALGGRLAPFDSPTTLALTGRRLLVVNSQLDHPPGAPPYTVSAVPLQAATALQALALSTPSSVRSQEVQPNHCPRLDLHLFMDGCAEGGTLSFDQPPRGNRERPIAS